MTHIIDWLTAECRATNIDVVAAMIASLALGISIATLVLGL